MLGPDTLRGGALSDPKELDPVGHSEVMIHIEGHIWKSKGEGWVSSAAVLNGSIPWKGDLLCQKA
jgi:hypothetical protein